MKLRVLIADDHKLFRQGLISLLNTQDDFVEIVGQAETGREAVDMSVSLQPDIILLDIFMPEGNGLEAARLIREKAPNVKIVILTSSEDDEHLAKAVQIGVAGFLLKNLDREELFELLGGIEAGEAAITRTMAAKLLKKSIRERTETDDGEKLTDREIDVLRLVAQGASNSDVSEKLGVTINTIKTHLKHIFDKLQIDNRTQAATYALKTGLVSSLGEKESEFKNHPKG
jgi:DNA-binding NarL/FixJ family response regulator